MSSRDPHAGDRAAEPNAGSGFEARFTALNDRIRARAQALMAETDISAAAQATDDVIRILRASDKLTRQRHMAMTVPIEKMSEDARRRLRHDMRNHLNLIIGYAEILAEDVEAQGPASLAAQIQDLLQAATALLALVNATLAPDEGGTGRPLGTC